MSENITQQLQILATAKQLISQTPDRSNAEAALYWYKRTTQLEPNSVKANIYSMCTLGNFLTSTAISIRCIRD